MEPSIALMDEVIGLCRKAGKAILAVSRDRLDTHQKADESPVTAADLAANEVLVRGLERLTPGIPILSEEQAETAWEERRGWACYWLVDPLDGTREFLGHSGEYTVNVALIEGHVPVLGGVHAPAQGVSWSGVVKLGAWRHEEDGARQPISVKPRSPLRIVASRSHLNAETKAFIERYPDAVVAHAGSSLKLCRIAEGSADLYPRFGPTSEWDIAAAQAVLEAAGGQVLEAMGLQPLRYNLSPSLRNPDFIACAEAFGGWRAAFEAQ
ncbi:3'(2'),5'-bisphosphate nucleotidase CysQ [Halomonas shantousis]